MIPEVTPIEVFEQIHLNLKLKKRSGFNLITTEVLKRLPNNVILKLTQIFNILCTIILESCRSRNDTETWKTSN